ncbi:MAG: helix-hairpin-helix domain-containing protein [Candidatus Delongbacteria bacterium]|nr:helix-hairpin-helix domain-containing protein [Candidatus Delongbacteria bacterium]
MKENEENTSITDPYKKAYRGSLAVFLTVFIVFLFKISLFKLPEINAGENNNPNFHGDTTLIESNLMINKADSQKTSPEKNIINDLTVQKKLVNINSASEKELCSLKGIGPKTAGAIIKYRNENGSFKCREDLMKIKGIGKKKYSAVEDEITF